MAGAGEGEGDIGIVVKGEGVGVAAEVDKQAEPLQTVPLVVAVGVAGGEARPLADVADTEALGVAEALTRLQMPGSVLPSDALKAPAGQAVQIAWPGPDHEAAAQVTQLLAPVVTHVLEALRDIVIVEPA